MTLAEKFELCYQQARGIVQRYRDEAPEGCDPQNSGIALATLVIGAGTAVYSAQQQKKQNAAQTQALTAGMGTDFKKLTLPDMPAFIPNDVKQLQDQAVRFDQTGFQLSDTDFKRRHRPIVDAEKLFEAQVLKDQQGEHELMPQLQNEFVRAGLQGSLAAFGDTPGTLAPGSAGEANVARNLGIGVMQFQDRNRENRTKSLVTAEELFPRRQFGLTGADATGVTIADTAGVNNWNQADYANKVQLAQYNATGQANFNNSATATQNNLAQVNAAANAERTRAIISAVEMAAKLGTTAYGAAKTPSTTTSPAATSGNIYAGTGINTSAPATSWKVNARGY